MNLDPWLRMLAQLRNRLPVIPPIYPWVAGILMLPIILHVPRYIDDYRRSIVGEFWLERLGRPLAELLLRVLSFGGTAVGVSPLLQLAAIPIIAICNGSMCYQLWNQVALGWSTGDAANLFLSILS